MAPNSHKNRLTICHKYLYRRLNFEQITGLNTNSRTFSEIGALTNYSTV